jgi:lipopolysaccharide/colanic/teichoic acid biosynthesis glycosyltransferase
MRDERRHLRQLSETCARAVALAVVWEATLYARSRLAWPWDLVPDAQVLQAVDVGVHRPLALLVVPLWLTLHRAIATGRRPWRDAAISAAAATIAAGAALFILDLDHISRTVAVTFAALSVPALALTRLPAAPPAMRRVIGVGPAEPRLDADEQLALHLPAVDEPALRTELLTGGVDRVHLSAPWAPETRALAAAARHLGIAVTIDADVLGLGAPTDVDAGTLAWRATPAPTDALAAKRAFDLIVGGTLLVAASPLIAALSAAVWWIDGGPAWFVQERAGLHGRPFRMFKLRTMIRDAEALRADLDERNEAAPPRFKLREDPRLLPFGRWLRRTSLDELPQLVNVVRGEMSLVGPRPALRDEVRQMPSYELRRLAVRPGLTGPWQVSGRALVDDDTGHRLDLGYVDGWTLAGDLWLLMRTVPAVLSGRGAW